MNRALLLLLIPAALGCDPKTPAAAVPPAPPPVAAWPSPGVLRLWAASASAKHLESVEPEPGTPRLELRMEYAGPAQGFRDRLDAWTAGRVTSSHKGTRRLDVPVRGELLLGFGTDPKRSGQQVLVHSVWLNGRYGDGGGHSTMEVGQGPLHERRVATWQPTWPLEIRDGQETLLWGIFVDEPAGDPPASLEERAKRAAAAWLYRVGTAEAPAEKQSD